MITPRTLPGFMELMPEDQILFNQMKDVIRTNFERFGFLPIDTPIIELSEVLLAKAGGETEKQVYSFSKGDNNLCLRFDQTVPLAKYVAKNFNSLNFPFARYQIGKVFRGERPQKGRFREFYQCDIDVIGKDNLSVVYDAQIPSVIYNIFKDLNVGDFVIKISNRKLLLGIIQDLELELISNDILRTIDKIDKIGIDSVVEIFRDELKISSNKINKIIEFLAIGGSNNEKIQKLKKLSINNDNYKTGIDELETVVKFLNSFGVPNSNFEVNLKIVRGLDYYTGTVYEVNLKNHLDFGAVSAGGRYDNLAGYYTSAKLPGVGMAIGLTRLFYIFKENNLIKNVKKSISEVLILPMGETLAEGVELSSKLRQNGINCEIYVENSKFKTKMNYADKSNIENIIIIGEDEIKNNYYTLKNMTTGEQQKLNFEQIIVAINKKA